MSQRPFSTFRTALILSAGLLLAGCQTKQAFHPNINPSANQQAIQKFQVASAQEPQLSPEQVTKLLRKKIKYVFVLYQENRSFDSYFGTYPGADGIYSRKPEDTPGFKQPIINTDGTTGVIQPFRIGPAQYAADTDDVDHSHPMIVAKMDIQDSVPKMDRFALMEEKKYMKSGRAYTAGQADGRAGHGL